MKKFTIQEIKNYLQSQDSFGDALYYLSEENIMKANSLSQTRGDLIQDIVDSCESDELTPAEIYDEWQRFLDLEHATNGIDSPVGEITFRYYPQGNPFYVDDSDGIATYELNFVDGQLATVEEIKD